MTTGKESIDPRKTWEDEGTREKSMSVVGLDLPSAGGGTEAGVPSPPRAVVWVRGETFKAGTENS